MKLSDLAEVTTIVMLRDELARVARGLDKARAFSIVMSTTEAGEVSCTLPADFAPDVANLVQKQIALLDNELKGFGIEP